MGKTFTRDQRKNNKYAKRDMARERKFEDLMPEREVPVRPKQKKKWRPHSETDAE